MIWQPFDTYPKPTIEWDVLDQPKAMFWSKETGPVIGRCILTDAEDKTYQVYYDRDGLEIQPTHWMLLPKDP